MNLPAGLILPFRSTYDPVTNVEGGLDPLGLEAIAGNTGY